MYRLADCFLVPGVFKSAGQWVRCCVCCFSCKKSFPSSGFAFACCHCWTSVSQCNYTFLTFGRKMVVVCVLHLCLSNDDLCVSEGWCSAESTSDSKGQCNGNGRQSKTPACLHASSHLLLYIHPSRSRGDLSRVSLKSPLFHLILFMIEVKLSFTFSTCFQWMCGYNVREHLSHVCSSAHSAVFEYIS